MNAIFWGLVAYTYTIYKTKSINIKTIDFSDNEPDTVPEAPVPKFMAKTLPYDLYLIHDPATNEIVDISFAYPKDTDQISVAHYTFHTIHRTPTNSESLTDQGS
jgi:hypothetical protein